ncbi:hypothetical protein QTN47_22575 [Danxiaibacter flavus]|uniref:Uncharacterized protein n=1 Tax=Danxiaibacter flavus TaxID=3049108 RepID=A0ABV3ZKJ0_9BACT|nr:hypothetical protein QNM32_22580 [Chitinophagaceae bacterium DXS]
MMKAGILLIIFNLLMVTLLHSQPAVTPNLIRNSYMNLTEPNGSPSGYTCTNNLNLAAVHPFTKGFEGPYLQYRPASANASTENATEQSPYWFGTWNKGPRIGRGGLADGWGSFGDGHILKISGTNTGEHTFMTFPFERNIQGDLFRLQGWIKIVSADWVNFGVDAGYQNQPYGSFTLSKTQTDAAPDGWYRIDKIMGMSRITALGGHAFSMGFGGKNIEVYFALPHLSLVENNSWLPSVSDMLSRDGLTIHPINGNVGIGTISPTEKLSVNGNIRTQKVIVTQTGWPDYVFDSSYNLPSLESVSSFIRDNKHLPEMPSASAIEQDGHDLGEVQKLLLKKTEELTLYLLQQSQQIKTLQNENNNLKLKVEESNRSRQSQESKFSQQKSAIKKLQEQLRQLTESKQPEKK